MFDADMNLESKVWKSPDYATRFTSEVYEKYGSLDDEKEMERVKMDSFKASSPRTDHSSLLSDASQSPPRKERGQSRHWNKDADEGKDVGSRTNLEDEYDFVDIREENRGKEVVPEATRATSLTSYFGSVASALYHNATSQAALSTSLTGTRSSSSTHRRVGERTVGQGHSSHRDRGQKTSSSSLNRPSSSSAPPSSAPPFSGHSSVALRHTPMYSVPLPKLRILIMAVVSRAAPPGLLI